MGGQRRHHGGHHHQLRVDGTRLLRICPTCGTLQDKAYDLAAEQKTLAEPCPKCGFNFPVAEETANSTAVFKDIM